MRILTALLPFAGCAPPSAVDTQVQEGHGKEAETEPLDTSLDSGGPTVDYDYALAHETSGDAGYVFEGTDPSLSDDCLGTREIEAEADGTWSICAGSDVLAAVTDGEWELLQMLRNSSGLPTAWEEADLRRVGCESPPADLYARFDFDRLSEACYSSSTTDYACEYDAIDGVPGLLNTGAAQIDDGQVMRALAFDGSSVGFVWTSDHDTLDVGTGDFTISFWIRIDSTDTSTGSRALVDKRSTGSTVTGYFVYLSNRRLALELRDSTGTSTFIGSALATVPDDGAWHHVAVVVDRDHHLGVRFYLDDALKSYGDPRARSGDLSNSKGLRIGRGWYTSSSSFEGDLDEVQLYRRALSFSSDVRPMYQAGVYGICP